MSKYLTRDQIISIDDIKKEEVEVPEWNGCVLVKGMTGKERDKFEASILDNESEVEYENIRAKLTSRCIVDENGKNIFNDADIEVLGAKSASALDRVFKVAQKLSGIGDDDISEMVKNSETDQSDISISN